MACRLIIALECHALFDINLYLNNRYPLLFINGRGYFYGIVSMEQRKGRPYLGFAEKVFSASATRRQSEAVYEYCELKPTK